MINLILDTIKSNNISTYLINETTTSSNQAYFIKDKLDQIRKNQVTKYEVTIYNDFSIKDKKYRGSSSFLINKSMDYKEIEQKIIHAYNSAAKVKNPYFELPQNESNNNIYNNSHNELQSKPCYAQTNNMDSYTLMDFYKCLYKNNIQNDTFINSSEIFINNISERIINSNGIDKTFSYVNYSLEYVVQSIFKEDVELYESFQCSLPFLCSDLSLDVDFKPISENILNVLSNKVLHSLKLAKDRSTAEVYYPIVKPKYIILEGTCVRDLLSYFLYQCSASQIYPGYSDYNIGTLINCNMPFNLYLNPHIPYSNEGIKLRNIPLIENCKVQNITGNSRLSYYLGIKPIGEYKFFNFSSSKNENITIEGPYLKIVNFSDFQLDVNSGQFGGEFRLAYYNDGSKEIPVTCGSISYNIADILNTIKFSNTNILVDGCLIPQTTIFSNN